MDEKAATAVRSNLLGNFPRGFLVLIIIDGDRSAALRKAKGGSGTDTTARAGDQCDFAGQRMTV